MARVPFFDAVQDVSAGNVKIPQSAFQPSGALAIVDQGQQLVAGYTDDTTTAVKAESPVIVFGDHTRALKFVDFPFAMGADGVKVLQTRDSFDAKFVYWYLRSRPISSVGYSRHFKFLKETQIPVPPLDEQRRISAILGQADAIRAKRRLMLDHLDALTQSVFRDMFESGGCSRVRIGAFAEVKSGSTPSRKIIENYGGGIPWVKTGEVSGKITETSESVSQLGVRSARLRIFPVGSIIIAMYGQGATRGRSAILGVEATVNQACAVIVPNGFFDSTFMDVQLKLNYDRLRNYAEGGSQPNLSLDRVAKFEVYNPPIDFQREFAYYVKGVTRIRDRVERALAAGDELFASLQYRAFRGEL
ncbi:restriction endonuclease subunit S [Tomitella cavernea]|nr:restriction endonuclease subunit S [Tomitella cavernea]